MIWILWDVDLLGTVKSFELAAILDWYDVNLGNIVFQFYLKANSPHKTYVVRSPKNSNWIWANVRQTLWKEITKQLLKKTVFDWRNVEKKKGKKYWLSPFGYVHPEAIHLLITKTYLNLPLACAIATNVIKTVNTKDIVESLLKEIANTSV